jgi:hypothetical protein
LKLKNSLIDYFEMLCARCARDTMIIKIYTDPALIKLEVFPYNKILKEKMKSDFCESTLYVFE